MLEKSTSDLERYRRESRALDEKFRTISEPSEKITLDAEIRTVQRVLSVEERQQQDLQYERTLLLENIQILREEEEELTKRVQRVYVPGGDQFRTHVQQIQSDTRTIAEEVLLYATRFDSNRTTVPFGEWDTKQRDTRREAKATLVAHINHIASVIKGITYYRDDHEGWQKFLTRTQKKVEDAVIKVVTNALQAVAHACRGHAPPLFSVQLKLSPSNNKLAFSPLITDIPEMVNKLCADILGCAQALPLIHAEAPWHKELNGGLASHEDVQPLLNQISDACRMIPDKVVEFVFHLEEEFKCVWTESKSWKETAKFTLYQNKLQYNWNPWVILDSIAVDTTQLQETLTSTLDTLFEQYKQTAHYRAALHSEWSDDEATPLQPPPQAPGPQLVADIPLANPAQFARALRANDTVPRDRRAQPIPPPQPERRDDLPGAAAPLQAPSTRQRYEPTDSAPTTLRTVSPVPAAPVARRDEDIPVGPRRIVIPNESLVSPEPTSPVAVPGRAAPAGSAASAVAMQRSGAAVPTGPPSAVAPSQPSRAIHETNVPVTTAAGSAIAAVRPTRPTTPPLSAQTPKVSALPTAVPVTVPVTNPGLSPSPAAVSPVSSTSSPCSTLGRSAGRMSPTAVPDDLSLHGIYKFHCANNGIKPNSGLLKILPKEPGKFISEINMDYNYIGIKGLQPLLELLKINRNLQVLNLKDNNLENNEVRALVNVLMASEDDTLRSLDLSNNHISLAGGSALIELLTNKRSVTEVRLNGTLIQPKILEKIQQCVDENRALQRARQ
eukprot:TRINITY_DN81325_c0_g1_i1.p1 TRINITY_DN81325_c0_g1~~TRINITY_DN81325_c0_g1_i1.p1  ORF type:complete len:827 (+),score=129.57 TRINITY_DN81325_c0_g1_i1:138-2483(+)